MTHLMTLERLQSDLWSFDLYFIASCQVLQLDDSSAAAPGDAGLPEAFAKGELYPGRKADKSDGQIPRWGGWGGGIEILF